MTNLDDRLNGDALPWLLEHDDEQPGVRYIALRWLLGHSRSHPEVIASQAHLMESGPVPAILDKQLPNGRWEPENEGIADKYTHSAWQVAFLAALGADGGDPRIDRACRQVLDEMAMPSGGLSYNGVQSGVLHCYQGIVLGALIDLGWFGDERTQAAIDWTAAAILGRGDPGYRKSGTAGPLFACGKNEGMPCGWGATKELRALAAIPPEIRSSTVTEAIEKGIEFVLGRDLANADFPTATKTSGRWFRFGFPSSYSADLLELLLVLAELGHADDPRAVAAVDAVLDSQDGNGRWHLQTTLNGKMHVDIERKGEPSKWLTLRALRGLKESRAAVRDGQSGRLEH